MEVLGKEQEGKFLQTSLSQDHTSQDHFCSMINEFPVEVCVATMIRHSEI